jgi:hypothetical protein
MSAVSNHPASAGTFTIEASDDYVLQRRYTHVSERSGGSSPGSPRSASYRSGLRDPQQRHGTLDRTRSASQSRPALTSRSRSAGCCL